MRDREHANGNRFGQYLTSKLLRIPGPVRFVLVWTGLVLLFYFVNQAIWF